MNRRVLWLTAAAALLAVWFWWENRTLTVSEYAVASESVPAGFHGFRIAQISDLHNAEFGWRNERLLKKLAQTKPDIIVMTGDLVDSRRTNVSVAVDFVKHAAEIAPCYFVTGNHESRLEELPELLSALKEAGVTVLRDEKRILTRGEDTLTLMGLDDPAFRSDYLVGDSAPVLTAALEKLAEPEMGYTIALSHRPEMMGVYRQFGLNLVFCGHAHGGQIRLPGIGGMIAPNQGFFPKYDAGVFAEGETTMVVSRGIGGSIIPLRVHNRPEIVVAELNRQEE